VGEIVSPSFVKVEYFAYPAAYEKQTSGGVKWYNDEFDALRRRALLEGRVVIGDIHSHPQWDAVMSPADYESAVIDALRICGICSVYGSKTRVRFWVPDCALPCEIVYK
jgi:proteasome lid subunit RPN8/RPN11